MKNSFRATALIAIPLAATLLLAGCSDAEGSTPESSQNISAPAADFNAADSMFATMMIPHHAQAVEMSDMVITKEGVDQRVLDLAQQIKDAQQPEIDMMQGWLDDWGVASDGSGMAGMDHGSGMMSDDDMSALEDAPAAEASRMFLAQMIEHHTGAIDMAETELADGQNAEAKELAQAVVDTQSAEITVMEDLLGQL